VSPVKYELGFYIPEDGILHSHRREILKSYLVRRPSLQLVLEILKTNYFLMNLGYIHEVFFVSRVCSFMCLFHASLLVC
jgi:hypothetical protein